MISLVNRLQPQGIQDDVPTDLKQMALFLQNYCLVPTTEEVA
jgi:hypothetical protein